MRKLSRVKVSIFVDGTNEHTKEAVLTEAEIGTIRRRTWKVLDAAKTKREAEKADLEARIAELG